MGPCAARAIAAPITSKIGEGIKRIGGNDTASYAVRGVLTGVATSTVNELTRVAIVGGKVNWSSVAIGGISGGIYGYGEGLRQQAKIKANILNQSSAFTGERINYAGGVGRTDSPIIRVGGDKALERTEDYRKANPNATADELQSVYAAAYEQQDLLSTNPSAGGLSIKAGAADSVKKLAETVNAGNTNGQSFADDFEMRKSLANDQAMYSAADKVISGNQYQNLLKDVGSGKYDLTTPLLKPYVKPYDGDSIGVWNPALDRAAAAQQQRTADAIGMIGLGPIAVGGLGIAAGPLLSTQTAILTSMGINGTTNAESQFRKYGEIKYPAELAINIGYGAIEGYLGKYAGNGIKGIVVEAGIGASSNVAAALTAGKYYQYDQDHQVDANTLLKTGLTGAASGGGIKAIEERKVVIDYIKKTFK